MYRRPNLIVILTLLTICILALASTIVLINKYDREVITVIDTNMEKETVRFELIKFLLQFLIIIIRVCWLSQGKLDF